MENDQFVFFYGGPFSQWYPCKFKVGNVTYTCAEQYMMAQKALTFNDIETQIKIMCTSDPKKQKAFGRGVKGFNIPQWNAVCKKIVYDGNFAKFSDPSLKAFLLATGEKEIVEASPYDTIWGIGLAEGDPRCLDKSQWRGTNWLGEAIMAVRTAMRNK